MHEPSSKQQASPPALAVGTTIPNTNATAKSQEALCDRPSIKSLSRAENTHGCFMLTPSPKLDSVASAVVRTYEELAEFNSDILNNYTSNVNELVLVRV